MIRDFKSYIIRQNHVCTFPKRIIYLDTEAERSVYDDHEDHHLKLAWTCYVKSTAENRGAAGEWRQWKDGFDLCEYIESKAHEKEALWVFGHNVYYDLQISSFYYYLRLSGWKLQFFYDKGLTYILVIRKGNRTIKAVSTTNYFQCSLKALGQMMGIEKLDVDFDNVNEADLSVYCRRDVEILKKGLEYYMTFVRDNDLGKFSLTKSSQAMAAYRHRFMTYQLHRHEEPDIVKLERSAYHGGRTECHYFGELPQGEYLSLDINSMYPFIMKTKPLPIKLIDVVKKPTLSILPALLQKYSCIAEVNLDTENPAYAVDNGHKLVFPVGRFKAYLCSEGLRYAISKGDIKSIETLAVYDQGHIFGHYVDYFYGLRKKYKGEDNRIMETLSKYFLNTLYGKFGEKHTVEKRTDVSSNVPFYLEEYFDLTTGQRWIEYSMFGVKVKKIGEREGNKSMVSIPAHITEYARFLIWSIMEQLGYENVLYTDTDSVLIRKSDLPRLKYKIHDTELGALKIENTFTHVILNGNKHYVTDDTVKIKGVPKTAIRVKPFVYTYPEFLRQASHMREGIETYYKVRHVTKEVLPFYDKGIVTDTGEVVPFQLELT